MPGTLPKPPEILCFGLFELDVDSGQLRHDGKAVRLQVQPRQLLKLLVEHEGKLVDRELIRQKLWPQNTFVEFDDSVNHAIKKLREALGDSAADPRFIETIPRQGYRFIAPVKMPGKSEPSSTRGFTSRLLQTPWVGWLMLAAALLMGCAALFMHRSGADAAEIHALAVLPLANMSGDPSQDYFSDGITEAIITELGKIKGIRVISRQSVMRFKHANTAMPQIARDLGIDAVVEGGIVRSGGRVRITAQLVAVNPERHVWAAAYERDANDVVGLQGDVAAAIARQIRGTLPPTVQAGNFSADPQVYELYLRAREQQSLFSTAAFPQAIEYLRKAVALDPNYAPAYAALAITYDQMGFLAVLPRDEAAEKAHQAVQRALALNDSLAEAHTAQAYAQFLFDWDWVGPDAEFRRALDLNPNSADAHLLYSIYLTLDGRFDEAIRENKMAITLDPLNPFVSANLGWIYSLARRPTEGIAFMQGLQQRNRDFPFAHHHLANLYAQAHRCADALSEADLDDGFDRAYTFAVCGQRKRAMQLLGKAVAEAQRGKVDPVYPAWMNACLGFRQDAFRWLDRAIRQRSIQVLFIKVMPEFDSLRSDPRFDEILKRANLR